MYLLQCWKESLSVFKPQNFKTFVIDVFNALVRGYTVWFMYWGWLFALYILLASGHGYLDRIKERVEWLSSQKNIPVEYYGWPIAWAFKILFTVCALYLVFSPFLCLRKTKEKKNFVYFLSYRSHFITFLITYACYAAVFLGALWYALPDTTGLWYYSVILFLILLVWLFRVQVLIMLDVPFSMQAIVTSFIQMLKLFWYNLPLWSAAILFLICGGYSAAQVTGFPFSSLYGLVGMNMDQWGWLLLFIIGLVGPLALITTIYYRCLHDQSCAEFPNAKGE